MTVPLGFCVSGLSMGLTHRQHDDPHAYVDTSASALSPSGRTGKGCLLLKLDLVAGVGVLDGVKHQQIRGVNRC